MKPLFLIKLILLCSLCAQAQYTVQGKIEYERKMNVHRSIDDMDEDTRAWVEKVRSQVPKFSTSYFDLAFNSAGSIYKPGREAENQTKMWFTQIPAGENVVYTDFKTKRVTAAKTIYEEKFLVQDSMRKIKWKITDEVRTVAEYKCRKAVGKICDSVYVVAFYTDDIMVSGGPEMFSGLPGMIMEIAIPRLFTTWIATKVDITLPKDMEMVPPTKGKKTTQQDLQATLRESTKRWGKDAGRIVWWGML